MTKAITFTSVQATKLAMKHPGHILTAPTIVTLKIGHAALWMIDVGPVWHVTVYRTITP
jgi:hypothetical protein